MSRKDDDASGSDKPVDTGHEDSTNLKKRLIDNQPLSDTHKLRDENLGEHRQYGMHDADPARSDDEPPTTRGSDG